MRLLHLIALVFGAALMMTLFREPAGRVAVIVFICGLAGLLISLAGVMLLFQTLGAFGEARGLQKHLEAVSASVVITIISAGLVRATLAVCVGLIRWAVPPI